MITSPKKWSALLGVIVFVLMLAVGFLYWFKITPVQNAIGLLERSLTEEEKLLENIENKKTVKPRVDGNQAASLQLKLPVEELAEQFILDLEKAEVASGSLINSMSFGDEAVKELAAADSETVLPGGQKERVQTSEASKSGTAINAPLPEGVEKLTIEIHVESDTYEELSAFVQEIEKLQRLTRIENVTFTGPQEGEENFEKLQYNLTVSAFYYPDLKDLAEELPKLDTPPAGNRTDPLYPAEQAERGDEETAASKESAGQAEEGLYKNEVKDGKKYRVYSYKVQPGDTLFSLAVQFYNSRSGEEIMKSWNDIDTLKYGTIVEIPVLLDAGNDET
ncbi:type IV pilus assembly protein PilO [Peribacillus deserti]|uniref:Type IV pilus assembly protein PilO n=1 Tax=Peribacillus deserti TaxID=673318 RepID=A0ABS2QFK3_9BACI|nr:type 4a pilus biogenesis protein PilO [Peribacillus deserti]MBM7691926.1 type IV pilus assembly protein PilO [Peribacillus deserti]